MGEFASPDEDRNGKQAGCEGRPRRVNPDQTTGLYTGGPGVAQAFCNNAVGVLPLQNLTAGDVAVFP